MAPVVSNQELAVAQIETSKALVSIADFITNGGLVKVLGGMARANAVKDMLGGLTTHDGRQGLDARTLQQNAIEIVHQVEAVFDKYQEHMEAKKKGGLDPELKNAEDQYLNWVNKENKPC